MTAAEGMTFTRVNLDQQAERQELRDLCRDYFVWMNGEITRVCGFSIPDVVKMDIDAYVDLTMDIGRRIGPEEGGIFLLRDAGGQPLAMGGLRRLPDGAAEIVRIYTRPECRGRGCGAAVMDNLIAWARRLGYQTIRLDTGVFMTSAHKIYRAAGFAPCEPYPGAEPPEALQPFWLYMQRPL